MTRKLTIYLVLAALMVIPQALAMDIGVSSNSASSSTKFSSTTGNSLDTTTTLSKLAMDNQGSLQLGQGGNIRSSWSSSDGKSTACAYGYFDANIMYTYSFT